MANYEPIDLSALCNGGMETLGAGRGPPIGVQLFHEPRRRGGQDPIVARIVGLRVLPGQLCGLGPRQDASALNQLRTRLTSWSWFWDGNARNARISSILSDGRRIAMTI